MAKKEENYNPAKKKEDWLSVILLSLYDDIFNRGTDPELTDHRHFNRDELWLNKKLTYKGQLRSKKFLRVWHPVKYIILGSLFACFIFSSGLSDSAKTFWTIAGAIIVAMSIYGSHNM